PPKVQSPVAPRHGPDRHIGGTSRSTSRRCPSIKCPRDHDIAHTAVPPADGNRRVRPTCRHLSTHGRPENWLTLVALAAGSLLDSLSMILRPAAAADPVRSGSPADPPRISYCRPLAGSNGLPDGCGRGCELGGGGDCA